VNSTFRLGQDVWKYVGCKATASMLSSIHAHIIGRAAPALRAAEAPSSAAAAASKVKFTGLAQHSQVDLEQFDRQFL
jgi:hypothetical protein